MATNEGIWISRPRVPKISKVLCEKTSMLIEIVRYGNSGVKRIVVGLLKWSQFYFQIEKVYSFLALSFEF